MELINRLLGLLLGLVLLALGVGALVETALARADRPGWLIDRDAWGQTLAGLRWDDPVLVAIASAVLVVGVGLAVLQLWPARPRFLPLQPHAPDRRDAIDGRGLQTLLRRVAAQDDDVLRASASLRRRKAKLTVDVPDDADAKGVQGRVERIARECVDALGLERSITADVKVERSQTRVR